jgi:hypothetical protein
VPGGEGTAGGTATGTATGTAAEAAERLSAADGTNDDLLQKYPPDQPVIQLDAHDLRSLFRAAYDWLAHNYEQVNRLNVFPVPDGDTGTNMLLTIKSAWNNIVSHGGQTVGDVAEAAAEGAHHGSRGNSGVILGQILHGFSQGLKEKSTVTTQDLAEALRHASDAAYKAVPKPVEGTILTVSREVSTAAESSAQSTQDLREMMGQIVEAANDAVDRTPEQLPPLKKAGVVDSGGKGLFYVFEGMYRALTGQPVKEPGDTDSPAVVASRFERRERKGHRPVPEVRWGFDVQYLLEQPNKPVHQIAADIAAMGDCPLVEGDEHLVKVHVHVFDPGIPLAYGVRTGFISDVVVENMDDMVDAVRHEAAGVPGEFDMAPLVLHLDEEQIGLVAVVPGDGFARIFADMGAQGIVHGGQSMNPSVADLADAIRALATQRVILLPNNGNIVMAAQQAARLVTKDPHPHHVAVVQTKSMPQGVAALTVYDPAVENLDELRERMEEQVQLVQSGEVTQAVRTAEVDGIHVHQGDIIGLHNDKLVSCGASVTEVALDVLGKMHAVDSAIVTVYYGNFVSEAAAQEFAERVRAEYPAQDVELAYGGQPHYHFILAVE